ncbi:apolipoprotein N-acyltransferase [Salinisphaera sp.]|uniref:apolipoprotein N-acyltransferase n=1 Tax=Salinisphaera sp. TaxID=1914330 RepID=UPI002D78F00F|nr:apolipoprotein N-acyltransferase [Salinisphaera sp.]HET7313202.1 apolipoprotein N-acyltransferase [Salinisphaera sp.]
MKRQQALVDLLLPAVLGGLATLGFAPWNLYPLTILALAGMIALWRAVGPGRAAWRGFVFGLVHFATGVYWVFAAMHEHAGVGAPLAGLATAALVGYLACYPALAGAVAGATRRLALTLWAIVVVPAVWCLAELLRGWLFSGFPWLSVGYVTVAAPLNGLAPLVGVHGLGIALVMAAGTLWLLYTGTLFARVVALALVAILPVAIWLVPATAHWTRPLPKTLRVAVLQGNIAPADERRSAIGETLRRYRDMTLRSDAELVIWPKAAIPAPAARVDRYLGRLNAALAKRKQTVLAELFWPTGDGRHRYDSVIALGLGEGRYDKRHLIPFGEYMSGLGWLGESPARPGGAIGRTIAGAIRQPLIRSHGVALGVSIGFEDMFGRAIRRALPGAGILINITNDGRFAGTAAPAQHLEIARMRALESGRPLVRAAHAGTSAVIGFNGRVYHRAAAGQAARLVAPVVPRRGLTPYMAYGDAPLWWASAAIVALALLGAAGLRWRVYGHGRRAGPKTRNAEP